MKKLFLVLLFVPLLSFGQSAEDYYFNNGLKKYDLEDYKGAISNFSKSIELNPDDASYFYRGRSKANLKKYKGSILDFTKAIKLNPDEPYYFFYRGVSKYFLKDYAGAIADYSKHIEQVTDDALSYAYRGTSKNYVKDYKGAIADYTKAIELDPDYASQNFCFRGISKNNLEDYKGAIADYTKAIELDPDFILAYSERGISNSNLGNKVGACADMKKAASLGDKFSAEWILERCKDEKREAAISLGKERFKGVWAPPVDGGSSLWKVITYHESDDNLSLLTWSLTSDAYVKEEIIKQTDDSIVTKLNNLRTDWELKIYYTIINDSILKAKFTGSSNNEVLRKNFFN